MEAKNSDTLLITKYASISNLHQDLAISNFFALTSSMDPVTINLIFVISQTQNNGGYDVLHNYCAGNLYILLPFNQVDQNT